MKCPDSINYDLASYLLKIDMLESFQWSIVDNAVFGYGLVGYEMTDVSQILLSKHRKQFLFEINHYRQ